MAEAEIFLKKNGDVRSLRAYKVAAIISVATEIRLLQHGKATQLLIKRRVQQQLRMFMPKIAALRILQYDDNPHKAKAIPVR